MDQASSWPWNAGLAVIGALGGPQDSSYQNGVERSCNSQRLFEFVDAKHNWTLGQVERHCAREPRYASWNQLLERHESSSRRHQQWTKVELRGDGGADPYLREVWQRHRPVLITEVQDFQGGKRSQMELQVHENTNTSSPAGRTGDVVVVDSDYNRCFAKNAQECIRQLKLLQGGSYCIVHRSAARMHLS